MMCKLMCLYMCDWSKQKWIRFWCSLQQLRFSVSSITICMKYFETPTWFCLIRGDEVLCVSQSVTCCTLLKTNRMACFLHIFHLTSHLLAQIFLFILGIKCPKAHRSLNKLLKTICTWLLIVYLDYNLDLLYPPKVHAVTALFPANSTIQSGGDLRRQSVGVGWGVTVPLTISPLPPVLSPSPPSTPHSPFSPFPTSLCP